MAVSDGKREFGDTVVSVAVPPALHPLARELGHDSVEGAADEKRFKIRLANTEGRRSKTSFLIQRRYEWRGYSGASLPVGLPNRITLAAFQADRPVATISVGVDAPGGLAVEALYPDEVRALRQAGATLCEFTRLAVDDMIRSRSVLASLFHVAYIYARRLRSCTDLVIEVNPRHVRFYRSMLGFEHCGDKRIDPRVGAPAILLKLRLSHAEHEIAEFGGRAELADKIRLLYPLFYSPIEEHGIELRLRRLDAGEE